MEVEIGPVLLESQERMIMVEEWWNFCAERGHCVGDILSIQVCISTQEWRRVKTEWRLIAR